MSPKKAVVDITSPKAKDSPSKKGKATNPKTKDTPSKKEKSTSQESSSSDSEKEVDAEAHTKAMDLFAQGKRHLLVNDINAAVNSLQESCRILAEQHGETSPECGDPYFYYGKALLEMARMESDVLGNALDGVPEEDLENSQVEDPNKLSEEEKEKVSEQVDEALQENSKSLEKASPSKDAKEVSPSKDKNGKSDEPMDDEVSDKKKGDKNETAMDTNTEKKEGGTDDESEDTESQEEGECDTSQEEGEGDGERGEGESEEEDVSNLQLAWEILEVAKVIYQKQEKALVFINEELALKTAQVFLKLGEVGLERENYSQSIEDFQSCLERQEKHMEVDDRCLAETHYQLGVAHSFGDDFDNSIESFTKALKIVEGRIANLKTSKDGLKTPFKKTPTKVFKSPPKDPKKPSPTKESLDAEIKELKDLIPEIKEKIEDMEEMKKDAKDKINKVKKEMGMASAIGGKEIISSTNGFDSSSNNSNEAKPISTTMIRKKRKPEDDTEEDASKKTKTENGEAKPSENGAKNGHSSPEKMDTDKKSKDLKEKAKGDMEEKSKELKKQSA